MRALPSLAALVLAGTLGLSAARAETVVYVDAVGNNGPSTWNNIDMTSVSASLLRDANRVHSGLYLQVTKTLSINATIGLTNLIGDAAPFIPAGINVGYGSGSATGQVQLAGLYTNVAYTFTFLATRAGTSSVDDVRTTLYSVAGANEGSATLDATGNTSQVAVVSGILPRADGTATLEFFKAPTNNKNLFYLSAFKIAFEPPANPERIPLRTPAYVDVSGYNATALGWNNASLSSTSVTTQLYDASNRLTTVTFRTTLAGTDNTGISVPALSGEALPFAPAGGGAVYGGSTRPRLSAQLSGLDPDTAYTLTFFACRGGVSDNRDTFFTATGRNTKSRTLNASSNSNRVAALSRLLPKADGTLEITLNIGPENNEANRYFYLNAFQLEPAALPAPDPNVVFLDANGDNAPASNGWNNSSFNTLATYALKRTNNAPTRIRLTVLTAADGNNGNGTLTPSDLAAEFAPVGNNNAIGHTKEWVQNPSTTNPAVPVVAARFSNLYTNIPYAFTAYAFREDLTSVRETRCKYIGATTNYTLLNVGVSSNRVAVADGLYAAADGTITLELTTGPNHTEATGFFYLAGLKITYPNGGAPAGTRIVLQ